MKHQNTSNMPISRPCLGDIEQGELFKYCGDIYMVTDEYETDISTVVRLDGVIDHLQDNINVDICTHDPLKYQVL